jgi:hypothetical protein
MRNTGMTWHGCLCLRCEVKPVMNAALLLMSSAMTPGGDVTQVGWGERPPMVAQAGGCCDPCATASAPKASLCDRLKARFGAKSTDAGCGCAPAPAPAPSCSTCGSSAQPNLLDSIRARLAARKSGPCNSCCASEPAPSGVAGCAAQLPTGATPVAPVPGTTPPKEMPKLKDAVKEPAPIKDIKPGDGGAAAPLLPPVPDPVRLPLPLPSSPTAGPKSSTGNSPF